MIRMVLMIVHVTHTHDTQGIHDSTLHSMILMVFATLIGMKKTAGTCIRPTLPPPPRSTGDGLPHRLPRRVRHPEPLASRGRPAGALHRTHRAVRQATATARFAAFFQRVGGSLGQWAVQRSSRVSCIVFFSNRYQNCQNVTLFVFYFVGPFCVGYFGFFLHRWPSKPMQEFLSAPELLHAVSIVWAFPQKPLFFP